MAYTIKVRANGLNCIQWEVKSVQIPYSILCLVHSRITGNYWLKMAEAMSLLVTPTWCGKVAKWQIIAHEHKLTVTFFFSCGPV